MNLLMHTCCAPCSITCIDTLRQEGIEPVLHWFNPNIHPYTEYRARRDTLTDYAASIHCKLVLEHNYGLRDFLQETAEDIRFGKRCIPCYDMRLRRSFAFAAANGFDAVTTTLLVSPYQNRDAILAVGERLANETGIAFLPYDFRPRFQEGQEKARELGLYMQKYCGCIFSEEERYSKKAQKALKAQRLAELQEGL